MINIYIQSIDYYNVPVDLVDFLIWARVIFFGVASGKKK